MRKTILRGIGIAAFAAPLVVFAHGDEGAMMGGPSGPDAMGMMELMHEHMDQSSTMDCDTMTDETLMEHGEEMMEEMMGHEDHERVEEAMEVDMADHDAMHVMMGMAASGCFGDEIGAMLAEKYGASAAPAARAGGNGQPERLRCFP